MMKRIGIILSLLLTSCFLSQNPRVARYDTFLWLNDSIFIIRVNWQETEYIYTDKEYYINVVTNTVMITDSILKERSAAFVFDEYIVDADGRYAWGYDNGKFGKYDIILKTIDWYNVQINGAFDIDWDAGNIMGVMDAQNIHFINNSTWEDKEIELDSILLLSGYEIANLTEIDCVKKNDIPVWVINARLKNVETEQIIHAILTLNSNADKESMKMIENAEGIPSPGYVYFAKPNTEAENNTIELFNSENQYIKDIVF